MSPLLPPIPGPELLLRPGPTQTWRPLLIFNLYRLMLALLMASLFLAEAGPSFLGNSEPRLFRWASIIYVAVALVNFWTIRREQPPFAAQTIFQVVVDLVILTLLMHASGGVTTGLGMLLVVSVAGGSLLLSGINPFLFAAVASLGVLTEQVYSDLAGVFRTTAYTQAGMLGVMFFSSALLATVLSLRARRSEALASRRGVDLANLERLNEHIIQHLQAGLLVVDADYRVRLMNTSAWYLLGLPALVEGESLLQISPQIERQLHRWRANRRYQPTPFRHSMEGPELAPSFTDLGTDAQAGTLVLLEDQARLAQHAQQLKLASLGRLTANIAHEIRNPLGALSHAAQLLGEAPELQPPEQRLVEIIGTHTRRMNDIVESVLRLSRRDAAHPETLTLQPWLESFLAEFVELHGLLANQVSLAIGPPATAVLMDEVQLRQILTNICENSLRYGRRPDGSYHLTVQGGLSRETQGPFVDLIDEGPGIEPEQLTHVFEPFFTTNRHSGTGLGLYVARELAENNRARLEYIAVPTGGSCFRITFADPRQQAL